ncbi:MAG TPA: hypothetical protein VJZ01_10245 [Lachnospiraceae bacterium]|nr:hypothetical protein [Lachnospiraceae bacterium]
MSLADKIFGCFKEKDNFTLQNAYNENNDKPRETIRARIYDNLGICFTRVTKGIYKTISPK